MGEQYTISQLARAADIPTTTVRYYERIGLVEPEDRSQGNYRLYSDESLKKLKFIRAAQATGFTLDDVRVLLDRSQGQKLSCYDVQQLIEQRLADVKKRLKDLRHVRGVLKSALQRCLESDDHSGCQVMESLRSRR